MRINRKIGYARVSKYDQDLKMQIDALLNFGCEQDNIFTDHISGSKSERPGLDKLLVFWNYIHPQLLNGLQV